MLHGMHGAGVHVLPAVGNPRAQIVGGDVPVHPGNVDAGGEKIVIHRKTGDALNVFHKIPSCQIDSIPIIYFMGYTCKCFLPSPKEGGDVSFVLLSPMQDLVYLRPAEQDDHTKVHPQHHHKEQRQTAVQIGGPGKIADI